MEWSQIHILQKFGVSSVIMPYFGYAHQSFLLLSRLSRESRTMLDDFYREMVNWLFEWNMRILINDSNIKMLYLPSDLFKYSINIKNESILLEFIQFIKIRHQHKGHYFNTHNMHERLWITNLDIQSKFIQELVPYFDILESIKLVDKNNRTSPDSNFDSCIINKFELQNCDFIVDDKHFVLPQYLIDASKLAESESRRKPFYKINYLYLGTSFSQTMSILEDIKNVGMQISFLTFSVSNKEELEGLTNPEYLSNTVSELRILFKDTIMLTDVFFENINQIKLKDIDLCFVNKVTGSFDIIRIFKKYSTKHQNISVL